ncbi:MAG TPA: orotidine-5'-phosphate decarboxylase [Gemmatimonadaceae bacterium]|nr:orotidine-5'-phosphate decarboxylase [Gemmatimonadaceae bacterium]
MTVTPIVALDMGSLAEATTVVDRLDGLCRFYKVGQELFTAEGPRIVRALREHNLEVFLDLKFHDIPNTVRAAVRTAAALGVRLVTVHAAGGAAMLAAAVEGAAEGTATLPKSGSQRGRGRQGVSLGPSGCGVLAVTVLTSMRAADVGEAWGRDARSISVEAEVLRLAGMASAAGAYGLVCSGAEVRAVRAVHGDALALLVPGIRPAGGAAHDQARVVTPGEAARSGAHYLVIGRAVTGAADPREAMNAVLAEIGESTAA